MSVPQEWALDALEAYEGWVNDEGHPWRAMLVLGLCALAVMTADSWF